MTDFKQKKYVIIYRVFYLKSVQLVVLAYTYFFESSTIKTTYIQNFM